MNVNSFILSNNIILRIISALLMLVIFGFSYSIGILGLGIFLFLIHSIMLYEWNQVAKKNILYLKQGYIIIIFSMLCLLISLFIVNDAFFFLKYFVVIWVYDSSAFIGGKIFSGPKLSKHISPNKTISGFVIGILFSGLVSLRIELVVFINDNLNIMLFILGLVIGLISQLSDLLMSYYKRKFNIKDYSNFIPGHGGFLDRFDSFILNSPVILLLSIIYHVT